MVKIISLLWVLYAIVLCENEVRYDDYKVYRVIPTTELQVTALHELENLNNEYTFWKRASRIGNPVDIMVAPHQIRNFQDFVVTNNLNSSMFIENVQTKIDDQQAGNRSSKFDFHNYHTLINIYTELQELSYKHDVVTIAKGGTTYQGRGILGVRVSFSEENKNRTVFLEGGIHANEWISPATVMYILKELLYSVDSNVRKVAESHDWYIFPIFNPDGYEYTFTTDRMWRKSLRPSGGLDECKGTDLNRNWDFHWMDGGASTDPCNSFYAGPHPLSDVEAKSMTDFINSIEGKLYAYISFHSYSQFLLIPYSFENAHAENYDELLALGEQAIETLEKRHGTKFIVGSWPEVMYVSSGTSLDWAKATQKIPITYTYELRDQGDFGFLLPPDQIIPTAEETFDSLITILQNAKNLN